MSSLCSHVQCVFLSAFVFVRGRVSDVFFLSVHCSDVKNGVDDILFIYYLFII